MKEDKIFFELLNVMQEDEVELIRNLLSNNDEETLQILMVGYLKKYRSYIPSLFQSEIIY
jgi:hypothetical protein